MATNQQHSTPSIPDDADAAIIEYYAGLPVVAMKIIISNTGDGLSDSMSVEPQDFALNSSAVCALRLTCVEVRYAPVSKDTPNLLQKVIKFRAGDAAFVDESAVDAELARAAEQRREAKEAREGVRTLFKGNGADLFDEADFYDPADGDTDDGSAEHSGNVRKMGRAG